jgi:hypothetical protein
VTSFLLFSAFAFMAFVFVAFFLTVAPVPSVHAMAEKVHADEENEEEYKNPVLPDPFHFNTSYSFKMEL